MANVDIGPSIYFPPISGLLAGGTSATGINGGTAITAANAGEGIVFTVTKTANLTTVSFYVNTVTTPGTLNVAFQTLTSGLPSGTNYGGSSPVAVAVTTTGLYTATFTTPATGTAGDAIAVVIQNDGTLTANLALGQYSTASLPPVTSKYPYPIQNAGSSWTTFTALKTMMIAVGYSTSDYIRIPCSVCASTLSSTSVATTATVRKYGALFSPIVPMGISGIHLQGNNQPLRDGSLQLLDSSGSSVLGTALLQTGGGFSVAGSHCVFDSGSIVQLTAGANYRCVFTPSTTTTMSMSDITTLSAAYMNSTLSNGFSNWQLTTQDSTGTWDDSNTTRYPLGLNLLVKQLNNGAGGGSTGYPASRVLAGM